MQTKRGNLTHPQQTLDGLRLYHRSPAYELSSSPSAKCFRKNAGQTPTSHFHSDSKALQSFVTALPKQVHANNALLFADDDQFENRWLLMCLLNL